MKKEAPKKDSAKLIGYARVSTAEQSVSMQVDALKAFGVLGGDIHTENMSGVKKNRPALQKAMRALARGDTLVVWKLDRIARSITNLLEIMNELDDRGIMFRSLTEGIETQTPGGRCIMHVMGALAQFERDLIVERTRAGVASARARGVKFGADFKLKESDMPKVWKAVREKGLTYAEAGKPYGVTGQTISRRLKEFEAAKSE